MINLVSKTDIINLHVCGHSKSEISRITHTSRPTVRNYINEYERYVEQLNLAETIDEKEEIIVKSNAKPKYDSSNRSRVKVTTKLIDQVKLLIEKNDDLARRKQRKLMMKKKDMHRILVRDGFDISYRSICNLVTELQPKGKEAFIRQAVDPGEMAEFDWGDVTLTIDELGGERRFKIAVFALKHSDKLWANLYMHENTECFLDAHATFIEDIGGVPKEIVYDNARVQVKKFVGYDKHPTDALVTLKNYYGFNHRFTNNYAGNEKGHVERGVEVVRRRAYCEKQCFKTYAEAVTALQLALHELNQELKQRTGKSANAVFAYEKKFLQPARIRLDVGVVKTCKVDKYSFIYADSNFYSVPDYLVGKEVMIKKYPLFIKGFYKDAALFKVDRICGRNEYKVDIKHYIRTLKKKPGAIHNSLALKQSITWLQEIFHHYFTTNPKSFIVLLELINQYELDTVKRVVEKLENHGLNVEVSQIEYELQGSQPLTMDTLNPNTNVNDINQYCLNQLIEIQNLHYQNDVMEGEIC